MRARESWLPDFCRAPALLVLLTATGLLAVVLALAPLHGRPWNLQTLFGIGAFALWIALCSGVALCLLRRHLLRLPDARLALAAWLVPVLVTAILAWAVHYIDTTLALNLGVSEPLLGPARFVFGCAGIAAVLSAVALRYLYVRGQWQAQIEASAQAQVEALQARIRPHFLFNSMNTIAGLVRRDPETAERAVEDLSDLFRAALGEGRVESCLADELELAERYLRIECLRLGERLRVRWALAEDLPRALPMPRLIVQPLVENAVVHGIARLSEGGEIVVEARVEVGRLRLAVGNPVPDRSLPVSTRGGHAQDSVIQRLRHRYGPAASMTVEHGDGYYRCELSIPLP